MTYNARNQSNDTTESQKEKKDMIRTYSLKKTCLNAYFDYSQSSTARLK